MTTNCVGSVVLYKGGYQSTNPKDHSGWHLAYWHPVLLFKTTWQLATYTTSTSIFQCHLLAPSQYIYPHGDMQTHTVNIYFQTLPMSLYC